MTNEQFAALVQRLEGATRRNPRAHSYTRVLNADGRNPRFARAFGKISRARRL